MSTDTECGLNPTSISVFVCYMHRDIMRRREFDPTNLDVSRERMNHRLEVSKRREAPPRDNLDDDIMVRRKRREAPPLGDEKPPRFPSG